MEHGYDVRADRGATADVGCAVWGIDNAVLQHAAGGDNRGNGRARNSGADGLEGDTPGRQIKVLGIVVAIGDFHVEDAMEGGNEERTAAHCGRVVTDGETFILAGREAGVGCEFIKVALVEQTRLDQFMMKKEAAKGKGVSGYFQPLPFGGAHGSAIIV